MTVSTLWDNVKCPYCYTDYEIRHRLNPDETHHHGGISLHLPLKPRAPAKESTLEYIKKYPGCTVAEISKCIGYSQRCIRWVIKELGDVVEIDVEKRNRWRLYESKHDDAVLDSVVVEA